MTVDELNAECLALKESGAVLELVVELEKAADENDAERAHELLRGVDLPRLVVAWGTVIKDHLSVGEESVLPRAKWYQAVMAPYLLEAFAGLNVDLRTALSEG